MGCCKKCGKGMTLLLLVLGLLFLIADLNKNWDFWGINWWTIVFLLAALGMWGCSSCKDCQACCGSCEMPKKGKKKK